MDFYYRIKCDYDMCLEIDWDARDEDGAEIFLKYGISYILNLILGRSSINSDRCLVKGMLLHNSEESNCP